MVHYLEDVDEKGDIEPSLLDWQNPYRSDHVE